MTESSLTGLTDHGPVVALEDASNSSVVVVPRANVTGATATSTTGAAVMDAVAPGDNGLVVANSSHSAQGHDAWMRDMAQPQEELATTGGYIAGSRRDMDRRQEEQNEIRRDMEQCGGDNSDCSDCEEDTTTAATLTMYRCRRCGRSFCRVHSTSHSPCHYTDTGFTYLGFYGHTESEESEEAQRSSSESTTVGSEGSEAN